MSCNLYKRDLWFPNVVEYLFSDPKWQSNGQCEGVSNKYLHFKKSLSGSTGNHAGSFVETKQKIFATYY